MNMLLLKITNCLLIKNQDGLIYYLTWCFEAKANIANIAQIFLGLPGQDGLFIKKYSWLPLKGPLCLKTEKKVWLTKRIDKRIFFTGSC